MMRLITWNCQGAFREKAYSILTQRPDILVVQECEHPDKLAFKEATEKPGDYLWFGDNKHKGIGIFSYSDYKFQLSDQYNEAFKYIVPITVSNGTVEFTLFAVWANNRNEMKSRYIEQVWKAVNYYKELLDGRKIILAGDFNSNVIWDKQHKVGNHSAVVAILAEKNIHSVYHKFHNQEQGSEIHPTFYFHRKESMPYFIDYCFASADLYEKVSHIEIGSFENWIKQSDHCPISIDFDLSDRQT